MHLQLTHFTVAFPLKWKRTDLRMFAAHLKQNCFTLIELMFVIIIDILAAVWPCLLSKLPAHSQQQQGPGSAWGPQRSHNDSDWVLVYNPQSHRAPVAAIVRSRAAKATTGQIGVTPSCVLPTMAQVVLELPAYTPPYFSSSRARNAKPLREGFISHLTLAKRLIQDNSVLTIGTGRHKIHLNFTDRFNSLEIGASICR